MFAHGTLTRKSGLRNRSGGVGFDHFVDQPIRRLALPGVAKEIENVDQSRPGKDTFVADVIEPAAQVLK